MTWTGALRRPCAGRKLDWQLPRIAIEKALRPGLPEAESLTVCYLSSCRRKAQCTLRWNRLLAEDLGYGGE